MIINLGTIDRDGSSSPTLARRVNNDDPKGKKKKKGCYAQCNIGWVYFLFTTTSINTSRA